LGRLESGAGRFPGPACSHRPALIAFHDLKLELDGLGSYTLETISHADGISATRLISSVVDTSRLPEADGDAYHRVIRSMKDSQQFAPLVDPSRVRPRRGVARWAPMYG
jgi:hypothetical protein